VTADLINLNKARKARTRLSAGARAAENRARHGLSKAEQAHADAERDLAARRLDGARRGDGEDGS